jgi:flagellar M-ring protein FliF
VGNLVANLQSLSAGRLITLIGAGAAVLLALVYLTMKMAAPPMVPLYTGIEPEAAGSVLQRLDQMGVPYQVQGESTVLVPADEVARLRMTLAADGLPNGGPVGYELLDDSQGLGITRFQEDIRYLRAIEGELARSIRTLNGVSNARVHLVLPKREPFQRQAPEPTASVLVVMRGAATLSREQVMAIQYLVAQAVPNLKPQSVSLIDQQGSLLAGSAGDGHSPSATQAADARASFETRLARSIEEMLVPHLGPDKVRVSVSADIDYDRVTERQQIFDPNGQVVRSTQTSSQTDNSTSSGNENTVGVAQNLPQQATPSSGRNGGNTDNSSHKEETVNYEISSKSLETVRESGAVKKLSVAVVVDGTTKADANGQPVYEPRKPEELAEIDRAVKAAIGFDEKRGDKVEVVNLAFASAAVVDAEIPEPGIMDFFGRNAMTLVQWFSLAIVALVLALFVLRPLVTNLLKPSQSAAGGSGGLDALPSAAASGQLPNAMSQQMLAAREAAGLPSAGGAGPGNRIGEIVDSNPEDAAGIIRSWMSEGAT